MWKSPVSVADDYQRQGKRSSCLHDINEGPQWFVSELKIDGLDTTTAEDVRALVQSSEGQPFSDLNVATDQDTVLNYFLTTDIPMRRSKPR